MAIDSPLTAARQAVCNAIDHWAPLAIVFRQKLYMERPETGKKLPPPDFRDLPSAPVDLPCIRVRPAVGTHKWDTNQTGVIPYSLEVSMWFPWEQVDAAESALTQVLEAMHQSKAPGDTDTFIGRVGCKRAVIEPFRVAYPKLGDNGIAAIQFTFGITIPIRTQPQGQHVR